MAGEWDGKERRTYNEMREVIREELKPIQHRQQEMREAQIEIERKIQDWESGAKWFRAFILGSVGLFTAGVAVWEWVKEHVK